MEEIASLWNYEQALDELKQRLLYTSLELKQLKLETSEETRKNNEYVKQLIQLLNIACKERDEAKDQLQKLIMMNNVNSVNSCNTESNSFSETLNGSSPVDQSFFHVGPSPDHATLKIESLVKGKPLPENGKFLQAVLDAPPLLQTLIVAAPLPRWRNPPQLKSFHIPPVSVLGSEAEIAAQGISGNSHPYFEGISGNSHPYLEMSPGTTQMSSNTMVNFPSAICLGSQRMISAGYYGHPGKRQRLL